MLILKRYRGEKIIIGGNIVIMVTETDRDWVKIGIDAPTDIGIWREELVAAAMADAMDHDENRNRRKS